MAEIKFYSWKLGLALALALFAISSAANKAKAQPFPNRQQILSPTASPLAQNSPVKFKRPPLSPRGAPGNRKGGGTRDGYICSTLDINESLMALVPSVEPEPTISHVWGLTLEASPTLWFYVPYQPKDIKVGELEIWDETHSDPRNYQQIYQGTFTVTSTPGAIALTLPSTVKLEPGKNYHWYLTLKMNCDRVTQAVNVNGWIQQVKLNNHLPSQQLGDRDRLIFYVENGIWFDAITLLAQMRRRQPETQIWRTDWQTLIGDIGLEEFANKPIVPCCQLQTTD
ncbi:DUF928 domain-containing protein [Tolypothrix sp. FACHB-123]|uniref:DUF928 domain-containing protein n=1 Tax=Tolypothrix sp. FACHB-123 TaxID=2692868 RepID=UPI00280C195A|nr:DUF928 domain-containing protein [Tolypothrix sp. FACHB-123]